AVVGGGVLPSQTFSVLNIGSVPVAWTASSSTLAGGPDWLQVSPSGGTAAQSSAQQSTITVAANPAALPAGHYYGLGRVESPRAANTPQVVTVFPQVLRAGTEISGAIQPGNLLFTAVSGGSSPGSQAVMIYNISATPKSFHAAVEGNLFAALPTDATMNPQEPTPILIQPSTSALAAGTYSAPLTLQFSDGRVIPVNVKVIVSAGGAVVGSSAIAERGFPGSHTSDGACTATKLHPALTTLPDSFQVSAGWPVALSTVVRDDCGSPLI